MSAAHVLGYPRIGARRELKRALEAYWQGELDELALEACGRELRAVHWAAQRAAGLDFVVAGDFAWYDQVLETLFHLGAPPARFGFDGAPLGLARYFAAARGDARHPAMELTKWFDTNYHYLVPEWSAETRFEGGVDWLFRDIAEARAQGHAVKAALVGPLTLLRLGKIRGGERHLEHKLELLPRLISAYRRLLERAAACGAAWVQIDEPILGLDLEPEWLEAFTEAYAALASVPAKLLLATYFESVAEHRDLLAGLPVSGVHIDLVRGRDQLAPFLEHWPADKVLSAGAIDGRNVWRADLESLAAALAPARERLGDRLWIATSCSLLHVPVDLELERRLEPGLRSRLAFAAQKLEEVVALKRMLEEGRPTTSAAGAAPAVSRPRFTDDRRDSPYPVRIARQSARLRLPALPTTTIGSFPQTAEIRKARAAYKRGAIGRAAYDEAMRSEIRGCVARQEALGLDVLVHGEAERNDMVEYFAEHLEGYAITENGWVQSYGSRCVKPPLLHGRVARRAPITVDWTRYAQSLTKKPMKGMLTGPITLLQWSFVREDQPRESTALELAAALRDEVLDLERAGAPIIQIDEPALREGLPLRRRDWDAYLGWAVRAFRVASCGVGDETQIHTHMCYAEFNDILPAIVALDADVITIETSRSDMELLEAFARFRYPSDIGPGVYDIHSPRVPEVEDMVRLLEKAARVIPAERLWVNPDCGLKTRGWPETERALAAMVEAARRMRVRASDERAVAAVG